MRISELKCGKIYLGDCLDILKTFENKSVDVSFTSPPYNDVSSEEHVTDTGKLMSGKNVQHTKYKYVDCREDWLQWQIEVIDELLRVSKKYVLYNVQGLKKVRSDVYKLIGHYADRIHDIVIWKKSNGMPTGTKHKLSNRYEFLLIIKCDGCDGVDVNSDFYTNVIESPASSDRQYSKIHRAVMSKQFCDEVIKEFTKEGDIVLDPFFGIGTTGLVCTEQNRKFIGIEIFDEYFYCATNRIKDSTAKNDLW